MAREASLQQTLTDGIEHHFENFHFSIPAIVVRSDLSNMQVDVQPSLNVKMYDDSAAVERPVILNVPLQFPVSKTAGLTFPVNKGDTVLLVFSERGLDAWKAGNGYPSTPTDFRMLDYKDAIAIAGVQPPGVAVNNPAKHVLAHDPNDTVLFAGLGSVEAEVRLKQDGSIHITTSNCPVIVTSSDVTINASNSINLNAQSLVVDAPSMTFIGNITQTGNYAQVGTYTLNSININLHKHTGVTTGTGTSGTMV